MEKTLVLIDGHSLLHRAFYGVPGLKTTTGEPTNAVFGFTTMLFRLLDDYQPSRVFVAFDVAAPTFRHEQYTEYKATRQAMPEDLQPQVGTIKEVLDAWGIPRLELAGFEADDILGTAAKQGEKAGYQVIIVTGDRDSLQLISAKTHVLLTRKGIQDTDLFDEAALKRAYGLTPSQIIDLKGLMGDASDNIPGVPGVGQKTAHKLLATYGSIDELYNNIGREKGKLKERLQDHKDQALLSRQLATIDCAVPLPIDLDQAPNPNREALAALFARLEFKSLAERIVGPGQSGSDTPLEERDQIQVVALENATGLKEFEKVLAAADALALVIHDMDLVVSDGHGCWHLCGQQTDGFAALAARLNGGITAYCDNAKALHHLLRPWQDHLEVTIDSALAGYVLDPSGPTDIEGIGRRYFQLEPMVATRDSIQAAAQHCERLFQLAPMLQTQLEEDGLWDLYCQVELPLAKVLADMEHRGIRVDPQKLNEMSTHIEQTLATLTEEIHTTAGEPFNINSPKQLGVILFDKLGLPVVKRTKTGPSTDAEVLEKLSAHPIVHKILEFRQLTKLKSTYADALFDLIRPETGRIHTTFNQTVTATGRLSSAHPNLQNIPIRTEEGKKIRAAFVPEEGWHLVCADYSQIELRILAHMANDEKMIAAFNSGKDIHTQTAAEVFDLPLDSISGKERSAAKAINFGIVYGISSFGLARGTNLSREKAQAYIDGYFARYPKVKAFLDETVRQGRSQGYVTTLLQRRRYLPEISSRNFTRRSFAERMAMNTPIQGSAADIIKLAMVAVEKALVARGFSTRLLLQVHDELVLEVPPHELAEVTQLVRQEMETVMDLLVKLEVDTGFGSNWRDLTPIEP